MSAASTWLGEESARARVKIAPRRREYEQILSVIVRVTVMGVRGRWEEGCGYRGGDGKDMARDSEFGRGSWD